MSLFNTAFYMRPDNANRKRRIYAVMKVFTRSLIFNKILRIIHFSNIMEECSYTGKKCIGTNRITGTFGKLSNHQGMTVSSTCSKKHFLHDRRILVCQIHEPERRCRVKHEFKGSEHTKTKNA